MKPLTVSNIDIMLDILSDKLYIDKEIISKLVNDQLHEDSKYKLKKIKKISPFINFMKIQTIENANNNIFNMNKQIMSEMWASLSDNEKECYKA